MRPRLPACSSVSKISSELTLIDTPGMLWPNIGKRGQWLSPRRHRRNPGYRASNLQEVASFIAEFLLQTYPESVIQRYDIEPLPDILKSNCLKRLRVNGAVSLPVAGLILKKYRVY